MHDFNKKKKQVRIQIIAQIRSYNLTRYSRAVGCDALLRVLRVLRVFGIFRIPVLFGVPAQNRTESRCEAPTGRRQSSVADGPPAPRHFLQHTTNESIIRMQQQKKYVRRYCRTIGLTLAVQRSTNLFRRSVLFCSTSRPVTLASCRESDSGTSLKLSTFDKRVPIDLTGPMRDPINGNQFHRSATLGCRLMQVAVLHAEQNSPKRDGRGQILECRVTKSLS